MTPLEFASVSITWRSRKDTYITGYSSISYLAPVQATALFHSLFKDSEFILYLLKRKSLLRTYFFSWLVLCLPCGQLCWERSKPSAVKKYCCLETNDVVSKCYWYTHQTRVFTSNDQRKLQAVLYCISKCHLQSSSGPYCPRTQIMSLIHQLEQQGCMDWPCQRQISTKLCSLQKLQTGLLPPWVFCFT